MIITNETLFLVKIGNNVPIATDIGQEKKLKVIVKRLIITSLLTISLFFTAKAQLGYNFAQFGIGAGVGYVRAFTDVPIQHYHPTLNLNFNYNFTPYVNFTFEFQKGSVSGGANSFIPNSGLETSIAQATYLNLDPFYRSYKNNFQTYMVYADVQAGEIFDWGYDKWLTTALKNIYIGAGVGLIDNKMEYINRISPDGTYSYGGLDQSQNFMVPLRVGYQFKVYNAYDEPSLLVDLGYQMNYIFGYGLDGYADPILVTKTFEKYGGVHVGIKYNFGNVFSYRKAIH